MNKKIISVSQFLVLLIMNRLVISMTFGSSSIRGYDIWDCIVASLIVFFVTFLLVTPMVMLCGNSHGLDISDINEHLFGKYGKILSAIYAFYFMLVCMNSLASLKIFIESVINPPISFIVLSASIVIFACYAASKGIEAIARSSAIILFFITFLLIFIGISLFKISDFNNFKPFFYDGYQSMNNGIAFLLSRMSCIPAMGFLIPMVSGNIKKGIIIWNTLVFLLMSVSIFLVVGVLGDLANIKLFPIYTATSVAKISKFENLDALYLGLWTSAIFLKLSMFLNVSSECLRKIFGRSNNKIIIFFLGTIMIFTIMFAKISNIFSGILSTNFLLMMTLVSAFVIPSILLILTKMCKREGNNETIEN